MMRDEMTVNALSGKRILLGVTGGIAAYKALDVVGRLRDRGAEVRVVMTRAATSLVAPLSFQARSGAAVLTDMWAPVSTADIDHIAYARWADLFLIAPATAHTLARMAHGLADDPLTTLYLAFQGPVVVAPAMNSAMLEHPATVANFQTLRERGVAMIPPAEGILACGETGPGKLAAVEDIIQAVIGVFETPALAGHLTGRHVLITAGPTREALDPVRYLSNPSTGRMGYALAAEAHRRGARVTLVTGPVHLAVPAGVRAVPVTTAEQMYQAVLAEHHQADIVVFSAAVADWRPARPSARKNKKTGDTLTVEFVRTPDIAMETGRDARPGQIRIGFAAETEDLVANARIKLEKKNLDFIVANNVSDPTIGFASENNRVTILDRSGRDYLFETLPKSRLAEKIWDLVIQ